MGCGSSSLKGDYSGGAGLTGDADPAPRPIKKVATNFSTVDYDQSGQKRRNTEYAPHETERQPSAVTESEHEQPVALAMNGVTQREEVPGKDKDELKPYQTNNDGTEDDLVSPTSPPTTSKPFTNGTTDPDPTSAASKAKFAEKNDPAHARAPEIVQEGDGKNRKSWLGKKYSQYEDARRGTNRTISEEELQKYTGKSKTELDQFVQEGDGVGGRQQNSMRDTPGPGSGTSGIVGYSAGGGAF